MKVQYPGSILEVHALKDGINVRLQGFKCELWFLRRIYVCTSMRRRNCTQHGLFGSIPVSLIH